MFPAHRLALIALLVAASGLSQVPGADKAEPAYRYTGIPLVLPLDCANQEANGLPTTCPGDQKCEISIKLNAIASVRENVFLAGEFHNGSQSLASFLLRSGDGGHSWDEVNQRIPGVVIDRLYFYDEKNGWATGHEVSVPPRDPFFLLTTDGGLHWRRRDVYSQPEVGVIEAFWFDDPRSGGLLIDRVQGADAGRRFERYETMTGGSSWMIREVSDSPIHVRNVVPAGPDPGWRLRAEEARGAWQVEQRQPGGWAPVAEFSTVVAICQPRPAMAARPEQPPNEENVSPASSITPSEEGELPTAPGGVLVIRRPGTDN